jgi:zinc finger HIT domain-containing protein 3
MPPEIRAAISSSPSLPSLLRKLDQLRGSEREEALEKLLGVMTTRGALRGQQRTSQALDSSPEGVKALKQLAQAVEKAVRDDKTDTLDLDWEEGR